MDPDPAFEYDAPTFMDFNLLQQGKIQDDDADEWFGEWSLGGIGGELENSVL